MVYAYLRVSTDKQETEKFKFQVEQYMRYKQIDNFEYVEETISGRKVPFEKRKLSKLMRKKDVEQIVCPELSRLGRSSMENLQILEFAKSRGITIHCVKESIVYGANPEPATVFMVQMLSNIAEYEVNMISLRTKEALAHKKRQGVKLGRPAGTYSKKLGIHKEEVIAMLEEGKTRKEIAEAFDVTIPTVYNFLHSEGLFERVPRKRRIEPEKKRKKRKK